MLPFQSVQIQVQMQSKIQNSMLVKLDSQQRVLISHQFWYQNTVKVGFALH